MPPLSPHQILQIASQAILDLKGHDVDVLTIKRPNDIQSAIELSKIVSKLSPIVGNLLEYAVVQYLNSLQTWPEGCFWERQDPGFPDVVLSGLSASHVGIEVKTWFPLATEMTARFRDSQTLLQSGEVKVAVLCWLPDWIIAGQPKIVDVWIGDALNVAKARDEHYHKPPHYLVLEPQDTAERTINLRQKNCSGYRFQGNSSQLAQAQAVVTSWGEEGIKYKPEREYQNQLHELAGRFPYRLDTNFAKIDRIVLESLEMWKSKVLTSTHMGRSVSQWSAAIAKSNENILGELIDTRVPDPIEPK